MELQFRAIEGALILDPLHLDAGGVGGPLQGVLGDRPLFVGAEARECLFDLRTYPGLASAAPAYGLKPAELEAKLSPHVDLSHR